MATTAQHIAARNDADLLARLVAAAEMAGIPDAESKVRSQLGALVAVEVGGGQTVADVHAYAALNRESAVAALPPPPGADPSAVTDDQLAVAVATLVSPST